MTENESEILGPVLYGDTSIYLTYVRSSSNKSEKFYNHSENYLILSIKNEELQMRKKKQNCSSDFLNLLN